MPRRGSQPGGRKSNSNLAVTAGSNGVSYVWNGERSLAQWQHVLDQSFAIVRQRAVAYWNNEEWTKAHHPYMTGNEQSMQANGFFNVRQTANLVVELEFGTSAPWAQYEEFGTARQAAHHPVRNTVDRVGYRVTDVIREQARRFGLGGGGGGGGGGGAPSGGPTGPSGADSDRADKPKRRRPSKPASPAPAPGVDEDTARMARIKAAHAEMQRRDATAPTVGQAGIKVGDVVEVQHGSEWVRARVMHTDPWAETHPDPAGKTFHARPLASDSPTNLYRTYQMRRIPQAAPQEPRRRASSPGWQMSSEQWRQLGRRRLQYDAEDASTEDDD